MKIGAEVIRQVEEGDNRYMDTLSMGTTLSEGGVY